jgi:hypothetical protein
VIAGVELVQFSKSNPWGDRRDSNPLDAQKVAYVCRPIANAQNGPFPELLCSALDVSAAPGVRKTIATTRTAPLSVGAAVPGLTTQQQDASIQKSFEDTFMPDGSNGD